MQTHVPFLICFFQSALSLFITPISRDLFPEEHKDFSFYMSVTLADQPCGGKIILIISEIQLCFQLCDNAFSSKSKRFLSVLFSLKCRGTFLGELTQLYGFHHQCQCCQVKLAFSMDNSGGYCVSEVKRSLRKMAEEKRINDSTLTLSDLWGR